MKVNGNVIVLKFPKMTRFGGPNFGLRFRQCADVRYMSAIAIVTKTMSHHGGSASNREESIQK